MTGSSSARELRSHWRLDEEIVFLNHGSFGACPIAVLEEQQRLRERMESDPVRFFNREAPVWLERARGELGRFIGADANDLAWIPNVTFAINSVLRSLPLARGDEIVVLDHEYNATRNVIDYVAERSGCRVVEVALPFPLESDSIVFDRLLAALSPRTRLVVLDHVTSQTGIVLPLERLIEALHARGVPILVDGAHAPGMRALDLRVLDPDYYTGNCHKWMCAPKGAGFLYVRRDLQREVRPAIISHGANAPVPPSARFRAEFDWMGTRDVTPWLAVPTAIRTIEAMVPGGWPEVMRRNRALALEARALVCEAIDVTPPCPEEMIGSLATIILPESPHFEPAEVFSALDLDPLCQALAERHRIEVPVLRCPGSGARMIRLSAHLYNERAHYERLAEALRALL